LSLGDARLSSTRTASRTFNIPTTKARSKAIKTGDGTDVAARYFVYKLYEATDGQPMQWGTLRGMGESAVTISRAVERGWVIQAAAPLSGVRTSPLASPEPDYALHASQCET
jgi:hypothetical protein